MITPCEDAVVIGKLTAAMGELGLPLCDLEIRNQGSHRLYIAEVVARDDYSITESEVKRLLDAYNRVGVIKPQLFSVEEYPTETRNVSHCYITVFT